MNLKITPNNIVKYKVLKGWTGEGVESDPMIIDSLAGSFSELIIKRTNLYVLIKNITIAWMELRECENITIENCRIYYLQLTGSSNVIVKNSEIYHGQLRYSRQNCFLRNSLQEGFSYITLSPEGVKGGDGVMKYMRNVFLGPILVILVGVIIGVITLKSLLPLLFLPSTIIPLIPLLILRRIKRRTRGLLPNIFKDNKPSYLYDLEEQFTNFRVY